MTTELATPPATFPTNFAGTWTPGGGDWVSNGPGTDDMSDFNGGLLGEQPD